MLEKLSFAYLEAEENGHVPGRTLLHGVLNAPPHARVVHRAALSHHSVRRSVTGRRRVALQAASVSAHPS